MSYTKAEMKSIFRRGVLLGYVAPHDKGSEETIDDVVEGFFESALQNTRNEAKSAAKPSKGFNAEKAIDDWIKRGRPKGEGLIEDLLPR